MSEEAKKKPKPQKKKTLFDKITGAIGTVIAMCVIVWIVWGDEITSAGNTYVAAAADNRWDYGCEHDSFENKSHCSLTYKSQSQGLTIHFIDVPYRGLAAIVYSNVNDHFSSAAIKTGSEIHRFECGGEVYSDKHQKCPINDFFDAQKLVQVLNGIGTNAGGTLRVRGDDGDYDYYLSTNNMQTAVAQFAAASKAK